jgi:hypothetical protein
MGRRLLPSDYLRLLFFSFQFANHGAPSTRRVGFAYPGHGSHISYCCVYWLRLLDIFYGCRYISIIIRYPDSDIKMLMLNSHAIKHLWMSSKVHFFLVPIVSFHFHTISRSSFDKHVFIKALLFDDFYANFPFVV